MSEEIWKDVPGYEGFYQVSNIGRVRSVIHNDKYGRVFGGKLLKQNINELGYCRVHLSMFKKRKMEFVHRIVAMAFLTNENNYDEVNHKDENPSNNCVDNLEWCSHKYNINYGNRNRISGEKHRGEKCCFHKLKEAQVREIKKLAHEKWTRQHAKELARRYNVSPGLIRRIVNGDIWAWVKI